MIITDPIHADIRSAINIKKAVDRIYNLERLGYCPTKVQQFFESCGLDEVLDENSEDRSFMNRDLVNQVCTLL